MSITDTLRRAVIRRVGRDSLTDVANHGAAGGYPGFCYYTDTCAFYAKHQKDIVQAVEEMADDLGDSPVSMVRGFNCLGAADYTESEVARTLYGTKSQHQQQVANALAWFALEEVAREAENA